MSKKVIQLTMSDGSKVTSEPFNAYVPTPFVTCSTVAGTTVKIVQCDGFELETSKRITVKFAYANTTNSPQLDVNSTGAKPIKADGDIIYVKWLAGAVMDFIYDGTYWVVMNGYQLAGKRVGEVITRHDATNPEIIYGGSWTAIEGRFPLPYGVTNNNPLYKGTYNSTTQYYINNIVLYNSEYWICKQDAKGIVPNSVNITYWAKYVAGYQGGSADAVVVAHDGHLFSDPNTKGGANYYLSTGTVTSTSAKKGWNVYGGNEVYPAGESIGESSTGRNMPPYQVEYVWRRTA